MHYTLREATEADRGFLWHLHKVTMKEYVSETWGWDEAFQRSYFEENFDPATRRIIVVDGEEAGVLSTERRAGALFLAVVEILPSHQGCGLGTRVIRDVLLCACRGGLHVTLKVLKANRRARRLYERLGFSVTGETETSYLMASEAGYPEEAEKS